MHAHFACEIKEGEVFHPVVVVDHQRSVCILRFEVEEFSHLFLDALLIVVECLVVEEVTLLTFARGVTNHTRSATHKNNRSVATTLQVT